MTKGQNTKQKNKDWAIRTYYKSGLNSVPRKGREFQFMLHQWHMSCVKYSILDKYSVIFHEQGKDGIAIKANRTHILVQLWYRHSKTVNHIKIQWYIFYLFVYICFFRRIIVFNFNVLSIHFCLKIIFLLLTSTDTSTVRIYIYIICIYMHRDSTCTTKACIIFYLVDNEC